MTRLLMTLVVIAVLVSSQGCGQPQKTAGSGRGPRHSPAAPALPGPDAAVSPAVPPVVDRPFPAIHVGVSDLATIPADLFEPQDSADRAKEYDSLVKRMIGDIEDEVKWQETLESIQASGTPRQEEGQ